MISKASWLELDIVLSKNITLSANISTSDKNIIIIAIIRKLRTKVFPVQFVRFIKYRTDDIHGGHWAYYTRELNNPSTVFICLKGAY